MDFRRSRHKHTVRYIAVDPPREMPVMPPGVAREIPRAIPVYQRPRRERPRQRMTTGGIIAICATIVIALLLIETMFWLAVYQVPYRDTMRAIEQSARDFR